MVVQKRMLLYGFLVLQSISAQQPKTTLAPWEEGMMDIHHINTGRGDATFLIFPDATTLLIDAGDMSETHARTLSARNAPQRPNASRTAPQWIADYITQFHPKKDKGLDYALITHYHDDHFGEWDPNRKVHPQGNYALTGIMEVGSLLPIGKLLDRGHVYPIDLKSAAARAHLKNDAYHPLPTLESYWKFVQYQQDANGLLHETLVAGADDQIKLVHAKGTYPNFNIRNIAVNGNIWTGEKNAYFSIFKDGDDPGENQLSTAIKISYGTFDYFTGGDISGIDPFGGTDVDAVESQLAPVVGPVDVATLNHHGNRDSQNAFYVRTIRPRIWIQQNWSSDHPGEEVLRRITSQKLYPGERDLFSTEMLAANKEVIGEKLEQYNSWNGHILVRVYPSGDRYEIHILNDRNKEREVLAKFGPYSSR